MAGSGSGFSESGSETLLTGMNVDDQIFWSMVYPLQKALWKIGYRTVYPAPTFLVCCGIYYSNPDDVQIFHIKLVTSISRKEPKRN
jgi:hypothetical protein